MKKGLQPGHGPESGTAFLENQQVGHCATSELGRATIEILLSLGDAAEETKEDIPYVLKSRMSFPLPPIPNQLESVCVVRGQRGEKGLILDSSTGPGQEVV